MDHGLMATFLTMFSDPKRVVTHSKKYTKPWKYATFVVSVSCIFTWFIIHTVTDSPDSERFWSLSKRMLELTDGYQQFYENTQPLKRLILGVAAFYTALMIFFFKGRNQPPGYLSICLYCFGHSVFLVFLFQSVGVIMFRNYWTSNAVSYIGIAVHILYLSYASIRILGRAQWLWILKGIAVMVVTFVLYAGLSTRFVHYFYFNALNKSKMRFQVEPNKMLFRQEETKSPGIKESDRPMSFRQEVVMDSFRLAIECAHPAGQEVSKVTLQCFYKSGSARQWSSAIFEKINRYSPSPEEVLLRVDSSSKTAFTFYRISNDTTSTIQVNAFHIPGGQLLYQIYLEPAGDDTYLYDVAIDSSFIYLCGKTINKLDNFDLGTLITVDKQTGKIHSIQQLGSTAFASWTSFRKISLSHNKIVIQCRRDYKSNFLFFKTAWSEIIIDKKLL